MSRCTFTCTLSFVMEGNMQKVVCLILVFCLVGIAEGGGCNAYTGSADNASTLGTMEENITHTGLAVRLADYSTTCSCGIVTKWAFYTRRNGTVIFYALDGSTVRGKTTIAITTLSHDNYYEIPLSSTMWISVKSGYTLGFLTPALPMITYSGTGFNYYYSVGESEVAVDSTGTFSTLGDRQYAVQAYIEKGHSSVFTNLPYTTSIYTHDTGINIITVSATDLDPDDTPNITINPLWSHFTFSGNTLTYSTVHTASATLTFSVTADDGCSKPTVDYVYVDLINEPPLLTNLPASVTIPEKSSGTSANFTIITSDPAWETVNCYLDTNDTSITANFNVDANTKMVMVMYPTNGFVHDDRPAYDLPIKCSDTNNDVYSSLNVDIQKNEPPVYSSPTGYLPASQVVGRDTKSLYTLSATDPDGDNLTYSLEDCSRNNCPINVSSGGIVTSTGNLQRPNYDLTIQVTDGYSNVSKILSILVSDELDFNDRPSFTNLPATIYVNENTPANTTLFRLLYQDLNTWDSIDFTKIGHSDPSVDTYFNLDTATGTVYVVAPFDYESVSSLSEYIRYRVRDGNSGDRENLTIMYADVNEGPSIIITTTTIQANEGPKGMPFSDPGLNVMDPDIGDSGNHKWSLDCGADSKYFYIDDADKRIYLAREYDMDSGLSGTATCTVSVGDPKGLSSTGTLTLSINNINDHTPKFPYHRYLFLQSPDDPFFTIVENLTATDADSNTYGSTLGTLTYSFDTVNYPQVTTYYQLDVNGILYIRDVSSFSRGDTYTFKVFATDSGGVTGTTTISVLFAEVETITTTTTQRNYTFGDDFANIVWLSIVCVILSIALVIVAFMIWFDPTVHNLVAFKLMRIDEWCRHKPKEPKRTVGKLTLTVNNKTLENDPDNALPWELVAKDANVPEMNHIQEEITRRKEKQENEYIKLTGRNVFEKGKGVRPASAEVEVHSSASGSRASESPKYDTLTDTYGNNYESEMNGQDNEGFDDGGPSQWDYRRSRSSSVVYVTPAPSDEHHYDELPDNETNMYEESPTASHNF